MDSFSGRVMSDKPSSRLSLMDLIVVTAITAVVFQVLRVNSFGADYFRQPVVTQIRILAFALAIGLSGCSMFRSMPLIRKSSNQLSFGFFLASILLAMLVGSILAGWIFVPLPAVVNTAFFGCSIVATVIAAVGIYRHSPRFMNQVVLVLFLIATIHLTLQLLAIPGPQWFDSAFRMTYPFSWLIEIPILLAVALVGWVSARTDNCASNILGILAGTILLLLNPCEYAYLFTY